MTDVLTGERSDHTQLSSLKRVNSVKFRNTCGRIISTLLLVALLVSLLPAQRPGYAATLAADTPVVVSPQTVRDQLYIAYAIGRLTEPKHYETLAFGLILQHMYKQDPSLSQMEALGKLSELQAQYMASSEPVASRVMRTANEHIIYVFSVLSSTPLGKSAPVVAAAREAWDMTATNPLANYDAAENRLTASVDMHHTTMRAGEVQQNILRGTVTLARQNPKFAQAWDQHAKPEVGAPVVLQGEEMVFYLDCPYDQGTCETRARLTELIDSSGRLNTDLADLRTLVQGELERINAITAATQATLRDLDARQQNLVAYANSGLERQQLREQVEAEAKRAQEKLSVAKSGIYILATLVGFVDPKLGKQISIIGNAGVQIADALIKFSAQVAGLGGLQALTSLSTVVLTGNILGAVMALMPLFVDSGPTPEQMILEQVGKLRQQVHQLRVEMHGRFDRIDKSLNTIYETLNKRFDQIDLTLGKLTEDVRVIQKDLVMVQKRMNRFEQNMFNIIGDGFRRPLWEGINGGIGYKERTGQPIGYPEPYADYENLFHSWATIHSFDALATGPSARLYDDDHLYEELSKHPLDTNVNYLAEWIRRRLGLTPFASARLPNPRDLAVGSRAYTEFSQDSPQHAIKIDPARAQAIRRAGNELKVAFGRIANMGTATAPQPNYALFDKLVTNYRDKLSALGRELQVVENERLEALRIGDPRATEDDRQAKLDLWGGASQQLNAADMPDLSTVQGCGQPPDNVKELLIPAPYFVARYLRYGDLVVVCDAEWIHTRSRVYPRAGTTIDYGYLEVTLSSKFGDRVIRARRVADPTEVQYQSCTGDECVGADPYARAASNWTAGYNFKAQFETSSALVSDDTAYTNETAAKVEQRLRLEQQQLYQKILDGLAVGPVYTAATRLSGSKAVLDAFITLGLPRALENDEFLRSFLYGDQRLMDEDDEERITSTYSTALINPPAGNIRHDLMNVAQERIDALGSLLRAYLDQIGNKTYAESQRLVETALNRTAVSESIIRTPVVTVTPSGAGFGRQVAGTASTARKVTITNRSLAAPITISSIGISGANAADFTHTRTCGATLAVGASCTVVITFNPKATGARVATLDVATNAPYSPGRVTLTGTGSLPAGASNLIPNPGLEADANNDTRPDGWSINPNVTRSSLMKRSGSFAMRHAAASDANYTASSGTILNLVPGAPYAFSGWVNIPNAATPDPTGFGFRLQVQWRDGANAVIGTSPIKTYTAATNGVWNVAVANVVAPAGTASAVVQLVASSLRGPIYVDDVFFGNLVANPGFELDINTDTRPDSWGSDPRVTRSGLVKRSGSYAMGHAAADNSSYTVGSGVTGLLGGTVYNFSGNVNVPSTTDAFTFNLEVQWLSATGSVIGTSPISAYATHTSGTWTSVGKNLQAPAGTTRAVVRMVVTSLNAKIYVDNLVMRP